MTELSTIIQKELECYETKIQMDEVGTVMELGDGIARISGLRNVMALEMIEFDGGILGLAFNLEPETVGAVVLGDYLKIREGSLVKRLHRLLSIPVGDGLIGRVIDPLGIPLDDRGPIPSKRRRMVEQPSPGITERQPVRIPLQTGIKAIDSMIPIGRGQRELIIGDRKTGKTAIAIDTILNQKDTGVICVYVAIGQKTSTIAAIVEKLRQHDAMDYTIIVSASASTFAPLQYIAPYVGCTIAEDFMYRDHKDTLAIYDDLTKQADAYRQLSLLLNRPPGREAYPGDVFYLHSRLLERAGKLSAKLGGGSLTALPIIETQEGEVSAYIPTNVISITDGQIYLTPGLFASGIRPAVDVGISVSRVGGNAQTKAMKKVAGSLRLEMAQYRELLAFSQLGTDLDKSSQRQLDRGEKLVEILKQSQFVPMPMEDQVLAIFAAIKGTLDSVPNKLIPDFEKEFINYIHSIYPEIPSLIKDTGDLPDEVKIKEVCGEFLEKFFRDHQLTTNNGISAEEEKEDE